MTGMDFICGGLHVKLTINTLPSWAQPVPVVTKSASITSLATSPVRSAGLKLHHLRTSIHGAYMLHIVKPCIHNTVEITPAALTMTRIAQAFSMITCGMLFGWQ